SGNPVRIARRSRQCHEVQRQSPFSTRQKSGYSGRMMDLCLSALALLLLLTLIAGLVRMVRGPRPADRMVALQFTGSTVVAILLLLAQITGHDALRNVALAFVLLALMALIAFVERTPPGEAESN